MSSRRTAPSPRKSSQGQGRLQRAQLLTMDERGHPPTDSRGARLLTKATSYTPKTNNRVTTRDVFFMKAGDHLQGRQHRRSHQPPSPPLASAAPPSQIVAIETHRHGTSVRQKTLATWPVQVGEASLGRSYQLQAQQSRTHPLTKPHGERAATRARFSLTTYFGQRVADRAAQPVLTSRAPSQIFHFSLERTPMA